ncbi:hypothetical protein ABH923_000318 [Leifsonia sp. EB41]
MNADSTAAESRGRLVAKLAPQSIGFRTGIAPVNVGWPFPRKLEIYENGLLVSGMGSSAWIPRTSIASVRRGPGYVRVKWETGEGNGSATIASWFRIAQVQRALESAGYAVQP